ncbi:S4 domain-containing protein, partial [Pseudomonas antarctica]|uniref:S4 domain-containing protein n=1 Tax=Pseudomonas antarctica TaxID=219572 RepID=UPI0024151D32
MTDPIRLSKRLIELVGCSRREAELFIEGGWVSVDGEVIDEPQFKITTQKVELDPEANDTTPGPVNILLPAPAAGDGDS